jgi:hypothetical protein
VESTFRETRLPVQRWPRHDTKLSLTCVGTGPYPGNVDYPAVNKAHIVPRCHLRRFAIGNQIAIHLKDSGRERVVSIDDAAVRRRFYRRVRPDGTPIDDVEWSLAGLEGVVSPILQSIEERWPLGQPDKVKLAELLAFQAVRGPRWRQWHENFTRGAIEDQRRDPHHKLDSGIWVPLSHEQLEELEDEWLSDTERLKNMMSLASKLIAIFAAMRWDLLLFDADRLVLSDHPVVEWPIDAGHRRPGTVPTGHGMLNVLEMRVPLSPHSALLLTWQDAVDGPSPLRAGADLATNLNAFSAEQADRQWMYAPGTTPVIGDGLLGPISPEVFPGYVAPVAQACSVRAKVNEIVNSKLGKDTGGEVTVISARGGNGIPSSLRE